MDSYFLSKHLLTSLINYHSRTALNMNKRFLFFLTFPVMFILLTSTDIIKNWNIGQDYMVKFETGGAVGTFDQLKGNIVFDPADLSQGKMDVSIDVATISTGNKTKDRHAKGKSWLYAEQYPNISFQSTGFQATDKGYQVTGELTLRGVKKQISIPFTFGKEGDKGLFEGGFTINRKDYGIKGPLFGVMVGNDIQIDLRVPVY